MRKRVIALLLTLAVLLPMLAGFVPEAKAAEADLESEIRQQLTAYISTLGKPNATGAKNKLINHALYGKGKYLSMGETDVFTVAMLNSKLLQEDLVDTLSKAVTFSLTHGSDVLYLAGSANWYNDNMSFGNHVFSVPPMYHSDKTNRIATLNSQSKKSGWTLNPNACDATMVDVVGASEVKMTLRRTAVTPDEISFHVELTVADDFNFDGSQSAATQLGNWMSGFLIDTYSWDVAAGFSFHVVNPCTHQTENYRWEFDGADLFAVDGGQLTRNELATVRTENGNYYETAHSIFLSHDKPWVLEFQMEGRCHFVMTPTIRSDAGVPYLHKVNLYLWGAEFYSYMVDGIEQIGSDCHGVCLPSNYYMSMHTYRLENRISADGRAMVYLSVDDEELGAMENHWEYRWDAQAGKKAIIDMKETTGWIGQTDFEINYIFNHTYPLDASMATFAYIQIWENGKGSEPYSYFETTTTAPTCTEPGKVVHTCSLCGASYSEETGEAALGHAWGDGVVTTPATCTTDGVLTYTCANDPSHTRTEVIPVTGHSPVVDAAVSASCTSDGLTEGSHCETCGEVLTAQEAISALGHVWDEGSEVTKPTVNAPGTMMYTCTLCGELRSEEVPYESNVFRLAGGHRYETAFKAADQMKENLSIKKFDSVVVASGTNFADALSGSYLAAVKNAPILLACDVEWVNDLVKDYIYQNLNENGTIYILGGEGAVSASFEEGLEDFEIERLAGGNRFETNLLVLEEAGVGDKPILVCTGLEFADSLSASATKLPILLVYGNKLLDDQAAFLKANQGRDLYILGGEGAVSGKLESALTAYGNIERVAGNNRFETATLIAEKFFTAPESAVLAYAWDFPDGLCGGPLATTMDAPLLLTMANYEAKAAEYIQTNAISNAVILGGETLIPESSVDILF